MFSFTCSAASGAIMSKRNPNSPVPTTRPVGSDPSGMCKCQPPLPPSNVLSNRKVPGVSRQSCTVAALVSSPANSSVSKSGSYSLCAFWFCTELLPPPPSKIVYILLDPSLIQSCSCCRTMPLEIAPGLIG